MQELFVLDLFVNRGVTIGQVRFMNIAHDVQLLNSKLRQCLEPTHRIVEEGDLLSLVKGTRPIAYRQFDRRIAFAQHFYNQFVIEIKTVALEFQAKQAIAAEY